MWADMFHSFLAMFNIIIMIMCSPFYRCASRSGSASFVRSFVIGMPHTWELAGRVWGRGGSASDTHCAVDCGAISVVWRGEREIKSMPRNTSYVHACVSRIPLGCRGWERESERASSYWGYG